MGLEINLRNMKISNRSLLERTRLPKRWKFGETKSTRTEGETFFGSLDSQYTPPLFIRLPCMHNYCDRCSASPKHPAATHQCIIMTLFISRKERITDLRREIREGRSKWYDRPQKRSHYCQQFVRLAFSINIFLKICRQRRLIRIINRACFLSL